MKQPETKRSSNILISIFLILTLLLSLGGELLYQYQKKNITIDKYNELSAISKLKVEQIVKWHKDHMDNARVIYNNQAIKVHINEYIHNIYFIQNYPVLKEWINTLLDNAEYTQAALIDPAGKTIIDTNPKDPISVEGYRVIKSAVSTKGIVFSDIFRYNQKKICQDIAIPLYVDPEKKEGFIGLVFLRLDPDIFLYSNILRWPIPVKSSEVLIAKKDGDSVLFMSELQHQKNSAILLRRPLSDKYLLIVQGLNGKKGVLEGIDYRGVKVIGDVLPVPGSPWYLVTKVDSNEIFNPIISLAIWLFIITFLLILIAALVIYFVWKKQNEEVRIIRQQHLQELVDEQTIDLRELNLKLQNDIVIRKRIEEQLRESEQRLSFHFENSPLAVVEWNALFNVTQWSKEAEHIFGWKAIETMGKPIGDLNMIYVEDIPIVNRTIERLSSGKEDVVVSSNRNYTKSGQVIETIWYNTILNDETGKMTSVMSLVEDITERKKTENELRKLSQAVEQSPISIVITDIDGVIEYGNPRVSGITGYTPEELLGKKPSLFKSDETPVKTYKELWDTILSGKDWQGEFHNRKKNGELYWEAATISPILDAGGKITHFLAIKEDITQRKKNEAELLKAKTDLEVRVLERTAELARSEERFRITLDNLMEGCMFISYDWTYLYANEAIFKRMHGTRESMIGHTVMEIFPGSENMSFYEGFKFTMEKRVKHHFVTSVAYPDGSVNWLEIHVEPVEEGIFVISYVITDRILAEQKLKKSENELKFAHHIAKLGYYYWDVESDKVTWSDELCVIMGIDPEKYSDKFTDHKIIYTPESWELANNSIQRAIQFAEPFNVEFEIIRHDNQEHGWINSIGNPIKDETGKVVQLIGTAQDITERKIAEKALQDASLYHKNLLEASLDSMVTIGPDGKITGVNAATEKVTGFDRETLIGTDFSDYFTHRENARSGYLEVFREGSVTDYPLEIQHKDGHTTPVLYNASLFKNDAGEVIGIFAAARDITERKKAESALQEREQDLLYAQQLTQMGSWTYNPETRQPVWSEEMLRIWGLDPSKGAPHYDDHRKLIHPDDWQRFDEAVNEAMEKGIPYHLELRIMRPDGKERTIISICKPQFDEHGKVVKLSGTNQDITERKLAEKALKESEEGFRLLAESVPHFVWITEADGMNIYFNLQWTEYTGMSLDESYGTGWIKPFHPDDQLMAWKAWKDATEAGGKYDIQCRLKKHNGEYHWFVIRGTPLLDSTGVIIKWYGTCTEIDSQKQLEEEITKMNEELEQRVNARTFQLQTANKELEAFAYSVSHDLRAPLRSIDGWSMALLEDCYDQLDKQGKEYLDRVRSESQRMGFLIDDLLKLSRVSRTDIKKVNVDLTTLAQDITKRIIKTPSDRHFDIIIQPGMFTMGDQSMLDIALTNLLDNAFKFTARQQVARIEFGQSVIDDKLTYWVRDNGVGFDMSYSKNLFGAFQRMHKQSEFPGTGVGLATVQRIIHRHDGRIWAESKKDQGTTFYFTITDEIC